VSSNENEPKLDALAHSVVMKTGMTPWRRWLTFNGVGLMGVGVQLGVLAWLVRLGGVPVAVATACAVEAAILHNFAWHQRVTWRDRSVSTGDGLAARLVRFHALNGAISIAGNVAITWALNRCGLDPLPANVAAILACSTANFFVGDRLVFARPAAAPLVIGALLCFASPPVLNAASPDPLVYVSGPSAAAIAAWDKYVAAIDARHAQATGANFFALDARGAKEWRERARTSAVPMVEVTPPSAPDGKIHHWAGAIHVPNTTVDRVVKRLQEYAGRESEFYQEVKASKLLDRDGERVRVFLRLQRDAGIVTVDFNTEHTVEYQHQGAARATSRSVATKIAEVENAATPRERERPPGQDHGFLWRLNAYWRFEQAGDGVLIECESVSLSRSVPYLLRPIASPIVNRIARESLERTLRSLRVFLTK
jgi:putative flippase GtrA